MSALVKRLFSVRRAQIAPPIEPKLYAYQVDGVGESVRVHLRADVSGEGVLIINASVAARLSASGVFIVHGILEGHQDDAIVNSVCKVFAGADRAAVEADINLLNKIISGSKLQKHQYPVNHLPEALLSSNSGVLLQPTSADIEISDVVPELLIRRLWDQGIIHLIIAPKESVNSDAIIRTIEIASDLGMITGIRASATVLSKFFSPESLAAVGLDHINLYLASSSPENHDQWLGDGDHALIAKVIENIRSEEICPVIEIPLIHANYYQFAEILDSCANHYRINDVAFFAIAANNLNPSTEPDSLNSDDLLQAATIVEEELEMHDINGTWYAPVARDEAVGLADQIKRGPRTSGDNSIYVSDQGEVYAARGDWISAGNIIKQDWPSIQAGPQYAEFLSRVTTSTHCWPCSGLAICAADCPRELTAWSNDTGRYR